MSSTHLLTAVENVQSRIRDALTFDDVLLAPAHSEILPANTDITGQLTRNIH